MEKLEKGISFYRYFGDKGKEVKLFEVLEAIKRGDFKEKINEIRNLEGNEYEGLKKQLFHFTPSGTFDESRSKTSLSNYNQLVILDIDKIGDKAEGIRDNAAEIEYTIAAFLSPGGKGVKILVNTDSDALYHEQAYNQVMNYYQEKLGVAIDTSGKDVSRACYVSWDPDLYLNEDSDLFHVQTKTEVLEFKNYSSTLENVDEIFKKAVDFTEKQQLYYNGNRNNFIHQLACNCNRYGFDEQITLDNILTNFPGSSESEVEATIRSAFNNKNEHGKYEYVVNQTKKNHHFSKPDSTMVCNVIDLINRNKSEPQYNYIWNGIKESSFGYVYGPPKVGKTIACENLGISIAAGFDSFLDFKIDQSRQRKVLFIGMEEFWRNRAERNQKQLEAFPDIDLNNFSFMVVDENFPGRLSTEEDWSLIDKIIIEKQPDVVFIDSMTRTVQGEIEDSSTSRDASFKLRELVRKYGITLIMIHHTTKLHGNPLDLDKLAGSRVIAQEADFVYGINRSDGICYLKEVATRYKSPSEHIVTFKINENLWLEKIKETEEAYIVSPQDGRENPANEYLIFDTIMELTSDENPQVDTKEVFDAIDGTIKKSQFYEYLRKLEAKGRIERSKGFISRVS